MLLSSKIPLVVLFCTASFLLYLLSTNVHWSSCDDTNKKTIQSWTLTTKTHQPEYIDMNINKTEEHILILTPFKQSVQFIDRFFDNVNKLTYPHHLITLGFLVSDSTDGTIEKLQERANYEANKGEHWSRFHKISIFQKDYQFELASNEERHAYNVQVQRRNIMAKSRNTLLSAALEDEHDYVLWLDGDVVDYPDTMLEELIGLNKDIIVPNCFWHSYNEEGGYDKNNWQETDESWAFQKTLSPDDVLVEGYPELITHRKLMIDMRNENGNSDLFHMVPLDGFGGTCTMVKAKVHRDGAIFPSFPFQHQVETEGLAKMAKALGYEIYGLPNYLVYHYI